MLIVDMPNGADLVDRAVLYERLKQWQEAAYDTVTLAFLHEVKMLIGSAPNIKASEFVRCGECKYFIEPSFECRILIDRDGYGEADARVYPDYFCADGERRTDEQQT